MLTCSPPAGILSVESIEIKVTVELFLPVGILSVESIEIRVTIELFPKWVY